MFQILGNLARLRRWTRINLAPARRPIIFLRSGSRGCTADTYRHNDKWGKIEGMPRTVCLLLLAGLLLASSPPAAVSGAETPKKRHALGLIGEPEYGPDFTHFKWVNPDAPKGGRVRTMAFGTFDSLNPYAVRGNAKSTAVPLIYDTLMARSPHEPSTSYGLVAEWVAFPDDVSSATFELRSAARFHDGRPIAPEDVIFTFDALKKASPRFAKYYENVVKAEKAGDRQVRFTFNVTGNRELPLVIGQLPVMPRHFWEATGGNGEPRDL